MDNVLIPAGNVYAASDAQMRRNRKNSEVKRQRQITLFKRHIMAVLFIVIFAVCIVTVLNTVTAQGDGVHKEKCYKSIMIEYGDTLWDIAGEYYDSSVYTIPEYIDELKSINGLKTDDIKSGSYLVVSYFVR
jgi:cell division protein YceG involved in septum cleavage